MTFDAEGGKIQKRRTVRREWGRSRVIQKQLTSLYIRGWKRIAGSIGVTVRHAHRLETAKGLPVKRDAHLREVRIRKEDLERWRRGETAVSAAQSGVQTLPATGVVRRARRWYRALLWAGLVAALAGLLLALALIMTGR